MTMLLHKGGSQLLLKKGKNPQQSLHSSQRQDRRWGQEDFL